MSKNKAVIYGVKSGDTYHYIGKTIQLNKDGGVSNHKVTRQYYNSDIRKIFVNNEVVVDNLVVVDEKQWYDEKLNEVVKKYKENNPLLNAQWMLDGKRGYWEDMDGYWKNKKRDGHTIQRLSESKFKRVCQYNKEGKLIKTWDSGKEIGIKIFGDYKIINGSACSQIYKILDSNTMKGRFKLNYYWFREEDLIKYFGVVPKNLNIVAILNEEKRRKNEVFKNRKYEYHTRYTVNQYDDNLNLIQKFDNTNHCAYELKISRDMVQRYCRGVCHNSNYILKFGEKKRQDANVNDKYPQYKINHKPSKKISRAKQYQRTKTRYTIKLFVNIEDNFNNNGVGEIRIYDSVSDCAKQLKIKESHVRFLCGKSSIEQKKNRKNYFNLCYGEKKTILIK